jgi:NTP pyrophosphatase (non-canonical NTP hydrolase)
MDLKTIIKIQTDFDREHKIKFDWSKKIDNEHIDILQFLTVALAGETGEFANVVKKIIRGDRSLVDSKGQLSSEIADVFIYVLKLSYQLEIDLEQAFMDKLKENEVRFEKYRINKDEI